MSESDVPEVTITPVDVRDWSAALGLLFATFPIDEQQARIDSTLIAVREGRLDLSEMRWAIQKGEPVGASLTMDQPDGVTLVWPPVVTTTAVNPVAVEAALMSELTDRLDRSSARLAQILLDPNEITDRSAYEAHGFTTVTDLDFLVRALDDTLPPPPAISAWECEPFDEAGNAVRFANVIEATYAGSQDCTVLDGLRSGKEALASHQLSGRFRSDLWLLYKVKGVDVGIVLLNEHPEQSAVELVYFGVIPSARGHGYGKTALIHALNTAAAHGSQLVFLAVDAKNLFATNIYTQIGFSHLSRRQALFRWPGGLARK